MRAPITFESSADYASSYDCISLPANADGDSSIVGNTDLLEDFGLTGLKVFEKSGFGCCKRPSVFEFISFLTVLDIAFGLPHELVLVSGFLMVLTGELNEA